MESKDKCEQIIQMFNGSSLAGSKDPLLVKFADGGQKKRSPFRNDNRMWREVGSEVLYHFNFQQLQNNVVKVYNSCFLHFIYDFLHFKKIINNILLVLNSKIKFRTEIRIL